MTPNRDEQPFTDRRGRKTVEDWARDKGTADWQVAAARASNRWPQGHELSEADYDAAVTGMAEIQMGYSLPLDGDEPTESGDDTAKEG